MTDTKIKITPSRSFDRAGLEHVRLDLQNSI